MAFNFAQKPTAKIVALVDGNPTEKFSIEGTKSAETSADNAAAQINKITAAFNVTVTAEGMHQIIDKEAHE